VEAYTVSKGFVLTFVIVNSDMGSKVLDEAKKIGVSGGTIFLGRGTIKNRILQLLGIDEAKKEIVIMVTTIRLDNQIHKVINEKFHMDKPNKGIIFSVPVKKVLGITSLGSATDLKSGGRDDMGYEAIFTIVDRGRGQEVVDAATSAGARGATIVNARGSGIHEKNVFFAMHIEPEKEIVLIIMKKDKSDDVIASIRETMHIDEPGKGILFVVDVNKTSGLFNE
jgi:nitrogen regulatory protein PII